MRALEDAELQRALAASVPYSVTAIAVEDDDDEMELLRAIEMSYKQ